MDNLLNMTPGDIILVHDGSSFIARAIAVAMKIYAEELNVHPPYNFHHAGTILDVWSKMKVGEA